MSETNKENPAARYYRERQERIESYKTNGKLAQKTADYIKELAYTRYTANFSWLGRPVIQMPQDLMALQEIIWSIQPDIIIETGIAHGGSLIFYASMLELIGKGTVVGIDIDIRSHNRIEIEKHPLSKRIIMIEGSSIDPDVVQQVQSFVTEGLDVMVCLDSNHTHDHVLRELELYAPLVSTGSYCVVFDTGVEDLPEGYCENRPWGPGNNPKTAVWEFLKSNDRFIIDKDIESRILLTGSPDGFLRCIK